MDGSHGCYSVEKESNITNILFFKTRIRTVLFTCIKEVLLQYECYYKMYAKADILLILMISV